MPIGLKTASGHVPSIARAKAFGFCAEKLAEVESTLP